MLRVVAVCALTVSSLYIMTHADGPEPVLESHSCEDTNVPCTSIPPCFYLGQTCDNCGEDIFHRECQKTIDPEDKCRDLGDRAETCGYKSNATCVYNELCGDPEDPQCWYCHDFSVTEIRCTRHDCKNEPSTGT